MLISIFLFYSIAIVRDFSLNYSKGIRSPIATKFSRPLLSYGLSLIVDVDLLIIYIMMLIFNVIFSIFLF